MVVPSRLHYVYSGVSVAFSLHGTWVNEIDLEGVPGRRGTDGKAASGRFQAGRDVSRAGRSCLAGWDTEQQRT